MMGSECLSIIIWYLFSGQRSVYKLMLNVLEVWSWCLADGVKNEVGFLVYRNKHDIWQVSRACQSKVYSTTGPWMRWCPLSYYAGWARIIWTVTESTRNDNETTVQVIRSRQLLRHTWVVELVDHLHFANPAADSFVGAFCVARILGQELGSNLCPSLATRGDDV